MKHVCLYGAFILYSTVTFSTPVDPILFSDVPVDKNTIVSHISNEKDGADFAKSASRTQDFPTQIVRTHGSLRSLTLSCTEVNEEIDTIFTKKISPSQFTYNTYVSCSYDPETKYATAFSINSYFDPLNDNAIDYVKAYIEEYNGRDLFGTPFLIESSTGVIIALNVIAGVKNGDNDVNLRLYRQDRNNFFFPSNYAMKNTFIAEIYEHFYNNDPAVILPFLSKWLFSYADVIYNHILRKSNYIELQPERIFTMEKQGDIFVSNLRFSYANKCTKYPNKRCL